MLGALWRLVMYRFLGGRVLLAISLLAWLRSLISGRRQRAAAERAAQAAAVKPAPRVVANEP
ncbi:MAG TPA: hypothetical protein VE011_11935 [Candidatus Dormibacteraeota bacterium]|nr:hypothetical protein [Candidatus Dormibacteraeota bacterium]